MNMNTHVRNEIALLWGDLRAVCGKSLNPTDYYCTTDELDSFSKKIKPICPICWNILIKNEYLGESINDKR